MIWLSATATKLTVPADWQLIDAFEDPGYWFLQRPYTPLWAALAELDWHCLGAPEQPQSRARLCRFRQRWWLWTEIQGRWWLRQLPKLPSAARPTSMLSGLRGINLHHWQQQGFSYSLLWLPRRAPVQVAKHLQMRWQRRLASSPLLPTATVLQFQLQRPLGLVQIFAAPLVGQQGSLVMLWQQQNR
ncbi:hypothetical protein A10D4_09174 [Idiomarina xiamenensis 10-D-4]|uniref:Uncharacterized protein n=2 Tax=Idiomarina xiamenensis TaxID=1207041 RepID=K2KYJ9_9GAMM|nr:hypothetical protein A10D4_09174 [Idiomarina xiamenensis 10-D-4]